MKYAFYLLIALSSFNAFSGVWDPPEKEIMSLLRRAERTPEAQMNRLYSNIEEIRVDRAYYEASSECDAPETHRFAGITKYATRLMEFTDCLRY